MVDAVVPALLNAADDATSGVLQMYERISSNADTTHHWHTTLDIAETEGDNEDTASFHF